MTEKPATNIVDVLKNIVSACEETGLRDLSFVRDAEVWQDERAALLSKVKGAQAS